MPDLRTRRYRVAQWATGTIGTHALHSIIEHPHLELTAVHVFGADKVGIDAQPRSTQHCDVRMPIPLDQMAAIFPGCPANRAVNAVRFVCAAEAGSRPTVDQPQIVAAMGI
ncbi:hypothetical protein [Mycolicibacterium lutetiense]